MENSIFNSWRMEGVWLDKWRDRPGGTVRRAEVRTRLVPAEGAGPDVERLPYAGRLFSRSRRRHQHRLDHRRPTEAIFVIERLIDLAADQLWLDPVALRRRNMSQPATQPYANPLGITYDSGRYEDAMDAALALADWDGFSVRRTGARKRAGHRARQPIPEPLPRMRAVKEAFLREEVRFAPDSPLEGEGFEPSVPRERDLLFKSAH
jgi:hypothetical protein